MKHGKHYVDAAKQVDSTKLYDVTEALELACKLATAKFDETVELHVRLGVDGRHADQQVRGAVVLPNGTGKTVRVCAIAKGPAASAAEAAGADIVGDDDLIAKIQGGFMDFDVVVTTPDMMGKVGRLGKLLGPRGLMPNPKAGTVTPSRRPRPVRSSTVWTSRTSSMFPSARPLSAPRSCSPTSTPSWTPSPRPSPPPPRAPTSRALPSPPPWALASVSTP